MVRVHIVLIYYDNLVCIDIAAVLRFIVYDYVKWNSFQWSQSVWIVCIWTSYALLLLILLLFIITITGESLKINYAYSMRIVWH